MELRVLHYFLMAAREENITRAAELLHITQPTLSRQLQQLEGELGVKLFQRGKHSIYLTAEGLLFRRRAQELIALAEKAKEELSPSKEELSGRISIGCGELLSVEELSDMISAFQRRHPLVRFHLHSGYNDDTKEKIEQGILDLGLLVEPVDISRYEFVRMRQREEWGILIHRSSPLSRLEAIRPEDLSGRSMITTMDSPIFRELASWMGGRMEHSQISGTYNLLYNAAMIARKSGVPVMCLRLNCHYDDLVFVPMRPKLELSSVLAWKEHQPSSPSVGAFIEFVKKYKNRISYDKI
ncbi:LysR family transcriptional regulator [Oscillibacter sp.]|uniref:LysR family transcriptional regulator n=1 Tax=Oscillibacter sp. TaxID=1945593 RepID=UPI002D7F0AED|nr:LysR family transcriptional regulator [Oscillibacter sp.]